MQGRLSYCSHLRCQAQHLLHQILRLSGLFQEQFHNCRKQLELHLHTSEMHKRMLKLHLRWLLVALDEKLINLTTVLHSEGNKRAVW